MEEKEKRSIKSYDRCMGVCHDKTEHNKKRAREKHNHQENGSI